MSKDDEPEDLASAIGGYIEGLKRDRALLASHLKTLIQWGDTMWRSRPAADRFSQANVALEAAREALASISENASGMGREDGSPPPDRA